MTRIYLCPLTSDFGPRIHKLRVQPTPEGVRLVKFNPGSEADLLGLKAGDVVHSISDIPVNSPVGALQAIVAIKNKKKGENIATELTRNKKKMKFTYEIVD